MPRRPLPQLCTTIGQPLLLPASLTLLLLLPHLPGLGLELLRLSTAAHLNTPRAGLLSLGQRDSQKPIDKLGVNLIGLDVRREGQHTLEAPVAPLTQVIALPFLLLLVLDSPWMKS